MNELRRHMPSKKPDMPFLVAYLLVLAFQLPVWLCAGLLWAGFMVALAASHPVGALVGGLGWGFFMWVLVGNFLALGLAWRRSAELPAPDRAAFRTALERVCGKLRLIVLAESADEVVLGPKRVLVRFRLQEVRVAFVGGAAVLSTPSLSFGRIRKALGRELTQAAAAVR
jgi:hypothetical protein